MMDKGIHDEATSHIDNISEKPKRTRQMTEEQLEKLKLAREKALQKKRELKEIKDGEKAMKQQELEDRKQKVEAFKSRVQLHRKEDKPQEESESSSSDGEVVEEVVVKKVPKRKTKKIVKKIIEVSSSSRESDSSDDETYRSQVKQKYKMKYKNKYEGTKQPRDILKDTYASPNALLREQASNVILNNVSKELRKIALESVFPSY
jgi:hypothetical protein